MPSAGTCILTRGHHQIRLYSFCHPQVTSDEGQPRTSTTLVRLGLEFLEFKIVTAHVAPIGLLDVLNNHWYADISILIIIIIIASNMQLEKQN